MRFSAPNPGLVPQIDPRVAQLAQRGSSLIGNAWSGLEEDQAARDAQIAQAAQKGYAMHDKISRIGAGDLSFGQATPDGFGSNVPRSLIGTESGGNWNAQNNETGAGGAKGHFGILQFGQARLEDAKRAGVIPSSMTPQQFKQNQQAQVDASNWHFNDIDSRIQKNGYDRMVGQTIGGVPISMNGMRAMAHLGGFGGLSKFIQTGGSYNPSDSFGTSLAAYGKTHRS